MKNNSASRIHRLMTAWRSMSPNEPALRGWLTVFNIERENQARDYIRVAQRIHVLFDELELLRETLFLQNYSQAVYQPPLSKLENAISPVLLTANCEHVKQHLSEDVFTGLGFCSELLPEEEDSIKAEEFSELVGLINQLELLLQVNSLPPTLVALIRRHIRSAELAIAEYPIRGATALKKAVKAAAGDLIFDGEILASTTPENAAVIHRLWKRMNQVADGAIKVDSLVQLGSRAARLLDDLTIA